MISNEKNDLKSKNKVIEIENDIFKNELNIMKDWIDVLECDFASLKFKSENLLNDVSKLTHKKKLLMKGNIEVKMFLEMLFHMKIDL